MIHNNKQNSILLGVIRKSLWIKWFKFQNKFGKFTLTKSFINAPGMIDFNERVNLYEIAKDHYNGKGHIVEFGAFFGSSIASLLTGLSEGKKLDSFNKNLETNFHIFDIFKTPRDSFFATLVEKISKENNLDSYLSYEDDWINFYGVFEKVVSNYDFTKEVHKILINDMKWSFGDIEILHLDLSKDWSQSKSIVEEAFPNVIQGGYVLFQDFVYHWSNDLISMIGYFVRNNKIKPIKIDGTTLTTQIIDKITNEDIIKLKLEMEDNTSYLSNFEFIFENTSDFHTPFIQNTLMIACSVFYNKIGDVDKSHAHLANVQRNILSKESFDIYDRANLEAMSEVLNFNFVMPKSWQ